jgi:hypothetical protein
MSVANHIEHNPLQHATGALHEDMTAETNQRVADMLARFRQIYVPFPRQTELHARCDYLIRLGQATRGAPQLGMRVLAPSGSGKTTAALALKRLIEAKHAPSETFVPVVYIPLEHTATSKKLITAILDFFGDSYSAHGNELTLKKRAISCFQRFGTILLIIDEVQHLAAGNSARLDVTDSLKRFLDDGIVPILFLGTEDATHLFTRNLQLNGRLLPPVDLQPLSSHYPADVALLTAFVHSLDRAIVDRGILPDLSDLKEPWLLGCLHEVSDGVIGRIVRLISIALEIALRRSAEQIEILDLSLATERWAVPQGFARRNPFALGGGR